MDKRRWYVRPKGEGCVYALGPITADSEEDAREWYRKWAGLRYTPGPDRLEVWPTND